MFNCANNKMAKTTQFKCVNNWQLKSPQTKGAWLLFVNRYQQKSPNSNNFLKTGFWKLKTMWGRLEDLETVGGQIDFAKAAGMGADLVDPPPRLLLLSSCRGELISIKIMFSTKHTVKADLMIISWPPSAEVFYIWPFNHLEIAYFHFSPLYDKRRE